MLTFYFSRSAGAVTLPLNLASTATLQAAPSRAPEILQTLAEAAGPRASTSSKLTWHHDSLPRGGMIIRGGPKIVVRAHLTVLLTADDPNPTKRRRM